MLTVPQIAMNMSISAYANNQGLRMPGKRMKRVRVEMAVSMMATRDMTPMVVARQTKRAYWKQDIRARICIVLRFAPNVDYKPLHTAADSARYARSRGRMEPNSCGVTFGLTLHKNKTTS